MGTQLLKEGYPSRGNKDVVVIHKRLRIDKKK